MADPASGSIQAIGSAYDKAAIANPLKSREALLRSLSDFWDK